MPSWLSQARTGCRGEREDENICILFKLTIFIFLLKPQSARIRQPLGRGATRLRGISSILYPGSSVVHITNSDCSLHFSYFRNLHPCVSVSSYSCRFDVVFCMLKSYSKLFGNCNWAQGPAKIPRTGHGCSAPRPQTAIENH